MELKRISLMSLAFRNLARHKGKTVLTMTAVIVGVTLYIFIDAWLLGIDIDSRRNLVNYETGSSIIYSKEYFRKKNELPMYETFGNYTGIIRKLEKNGYDAAPRSVFGGTLISPDKEIPFLFTGIDTEKENTVFKYGKYIEKGAFVKKGEFGIMIGYIGAKNLKVDVGNMVRLFTIIDRKDESGTVRHITQAMDLKITGLINSPNPKLNGNVGFLPLDILQDSMGLQLEGNITEIHIRKQNASETGLPGKSESPDTVRKILGSDLPENLLLVGWQEDARDFLLVSQSKNTTSKVMVLLLFIIAYIGIANTILMSVMERTREIGMLRALGMFDFSILKMFIYEAGLIGLFGSAIGMALGAIINIFMVNFGIDFTKILEAYGTNYGYRVVGVFKSAWNFSTIFFSGIIVTVLSGLTAILPTLRALKITITDALHFD
jgi:ABC-type lipoprotein release transport system permease subunit